MAGRPDQTTGSADGGERLRRVFSAAGEAGSPGRQDADDHRRTDSHREPQKRRSWRIDAQAGRGGPRAVRRRGVTAMNTRVPHLGTYRRELPVSLERLYENAIDWEHLPYLHRSSFSRIERIESGEWGFRARVWTHPFEEQRGLVVIELKLDRDCRRWITRTLAGSGTGTEIWTHAFSLAERTTLVVVDFFVPDTAETAAVRLRDYYQRLYARLYDEDVGMMTLRQNEIDRIRAGQPSGKTTPQVIGGIADLLARLPLET